MRNKIEFTVKIQAEIENNFELSREIFLDIPFYSIKLLTSIDEKIAQIIPVNFLSCKTTEIKTLD